MPSDHHTDVSYFARSNFRNKNTLIGIRQVDRLSHFYIIGKTGVGKSTLLETMALQDMAAGRGFALIDPHGDLVERIARNLPSEQKARVIYLDATDPQQPYGYNPLRRVRQEKIPLAVSGLLETLRKLWPDAWGVRMEHVLRNSLYALLERDGSTLSDILQLYSDEDFRKAIVADIRNETVRRFWQDEFEHYPPRLRAEACAPIQNKLGVLLSDPALHRLLVKPAIDLHFRALMDAGKILLVNVSKGQLGEMSSHLLGALVLSTLALAALSRAETDERRPFFIYADEFQAFTTLMIATMLPELRKYGIGLTLAHQYLAQLDSDIRSAVIGNAGTLITFRVGAEDAPFLARELLPRFDTEDILGLSNHSIYLRLMIDGTPSKPFSGNTIVFDRPKIPLNTKKAAVP
jgi:hypothetical protein